MPSSLNQDGIQNYTLTDNSLVAETPTEWDRQLYFDTAVRNLHLKHGEVIIDRLNNVEDTKGNNGVAGILFITNMRMIWYLADSQTSNLSVGLNCIASTNIQQSASRLMSNSQCLCVYVKFKGSSYEFTFTHLIPDSPRMFVTVQSVIRAYQSSRMYRELKIRGTFMTPAKQLILLPDEILDEQITGIWNLSGEQGHLGAFQLTNVRLVWYSLMNDVFNMSLPFRQIQMIKTQESKFGSTLIIETCNSSSKYLLGFRVDPPSRIKPVVQKIMQQWKLVNLNPIFGVSVQVDEQQQQHDQDEFSDNQDEGSIKIMDEQLELFHINQGSTEDIDATTADRDYEGNAYLKRRKSLVPGQARDIVFDNSIGLAVEKLPNGQTMQQLWNAL